MYYPGRTVEAKYKLTQDVLHPTCVLLGKIEGIWEMDEEVTSGVRVSRETVGVETASRILAAIVGQVYADLYCAIYLLPMTPMLAWSLATLNPDVPQLSLEEHLAVRSLIDPG